MAPVASDEIARLQAEFTRFARIGCTEDPLYVALSLAAAERPEWAGLLAAALPTQRLPMLWFAALHDRLLELHEAGRDPALAAWYPSLGGGRPPDDALIPAVDKFLATDADVMRQRIATRATQTNEVGRCAVLHPVLGWLAERLGHARFALLDVGCSAGLNLGVDRWSYRYLDSAVGQPFAEVEGLEPQAGPRIDCRVFHDAGLQGLASLLASASSSSPAASIVSRIGIDPAPIDVADEAAVRWLRACLWPYDTTRRARLDAAVAVARTQRWPLQRVAAPDVRAAITRWLAEVPPDIQPVVFNSWVLAYFDAPALDAHVATLREGIERRGLAWISAEPIERVRRWWPDVPDLGDPPPNAGVSSDEIRGATLWTVGLRGDEGGVDWTLVARSHGHGRWLQWRGPRARTGAGRPS